MNFKSNNNNSELRENHGNTNRNSVHEEQIVSRPQIKSFSSKPVQKKVLLEIGKIQPYMK